MVEVENNLEKERRALLDLEKQAVKGDLQLQTIQNIEGEVDSCMHFMFYLLHSFSCYTQFIVFIRLLTK